ncbi:Rhodanese-like domain-domain-containing protein [Ostreococcus tauri]|uniref:Rhodanese-like domain-domain-containing protein n=1 Tax=Ostreococcus tauri TaxID=70448 RepID=A0A1Y5I038_OSTTA|nr:Rhodanese-like domain-domain-containing protein [Ostreococcus tauri]
MFPSTTANALDARARAPEAMRPRANGKQRGRGTRWGRSKRFQVVAVDPKNPLGRANARGIVPGMGPGAREWRLIHKELKTKYRMPTVSSAECAKMMRQGGKPATLLDVRFGPDFEQWAVPGSVSVPYVEGGILAKLRLPGFKKVNARFVDDVERAIPDKTTKIILCDIWGGSLEREPPENKSFTDPTKGAGSLPAAFELYQAGYKNLYHLRGGVNQYFEDCETNKDLPEPDPKSWPGNLEWFGYRQFNGKDRARGQRDD